MTYHKGKVLHLLSDWRWTGPADPTILLCKALQQMGWEVTLACRRPPKGVTQSISQKAMEMGVPVTTDLKLNRYLSPKDTLGDLIEMPGYVLKHGFDLIHCHLSHDHFLAGWSSRLCKRRVPVVRTNHKAVPLRPNIWNRLLLGLWSDGLIEFSKRAMMEDQARFRLREGAVALVNPAVDTQFFDPSKVGSCIRGEIGVSDGEVLAGIVARVQRHRRFELLLEAMRLLGDQQPPIKLMVVGRGTHRESVAIEPARRMGLGERVIFVGYRRGDYRDYLAAMDFKVFLVPGSDGTCRAVREAMAMGKPVVATKRGMLPELVDHGFTGLLVDERPEDIAGGMLTLARDPKRRLKMGQAARAKAVESFCLGRQAELVDSFYSKILRSFGDLR